jgi:hypothetical protein
MKRFVRNSATLFAATAAFLGTAVLPSVSSAQADEPVPCPRVIGVCTYSESEAQGDLRLYFRDEPLADPAFRTVQNQTPEPWCVFENPYFGSPQQQVEPWETIRDLPFAAASLRRGPC